MFKRFGGGSRRRSFKKVVRRMKAPRRFYKTSKRVHKMNRVPRGGFRM